MYICVSEHMYMCMCVSIYIYICLFIYLYVYMYVLCRQHSPDDPKQTGLPGGRIT